MTGDVPHLELRKVSPAAVEVGGLLARAVIRQANLPRQYVTRTTTGAAWLVPAFCVPAVVATAQRMGGVARFVETAQLTLGDPS
ncbi:MAG TPA: hypothetical protein VG650_13435 [Mycobacteriales bacterium]|nr:hypothetical protein [Mycobacteriales bacterium]